MTKWTQPMNEIVQLIGPDGQVFDLTTESDVGNWVLEMSGWGMPDIDYISQQGPFQHGVSARDYRLKPRTVQLSVRQQDCTRDGYWARRTELLNSMRPNRQPVGLSGAFIARSQYQYEAEWGIRALCEFNNQLFGGTLLHGLLFRWNGSTQWYKVADQLNAQTHIYSLIVYDDGGGVDELYAGTYNLGKLFKWNGLDAWTEVCDQLNGQEYIYDMAIFNDGLGGGNQIFAGTASGGRLFHYDVGGGVWSQDCAQLNAETEIRSLCVYDDDGLGDDLYGGTSPNGKLYRYNPAGPAWVEVCAQHASLQTRINDLIVYNGQLYGCTYPNGRLFRYLPAGPQWVSVAPQYGLNTSIYKLVIYQGRLYGVGERDLLIWDGEDQWYPAATKYRNEQPMYSGISFNNRLFTGTYSGAYLLEYIRRSGESSLPCFTLRRVLSDGSVRDLCVHIDKGPEFTGPRKGWDEYSLQEVLRFWAPNPIIYDPTEQDGPTYTMDPGATGVVNETQALIYPGTWEEHPTFVLTGPMNNPVIRNEGTDEFIELDYNIVNGRVVTITLTPGDQIIEDDLGVNLIGVVTPESNLASFHLAPDPEVADGENDITIIATGTTATTDFAITYYNRYIGI